MQRHDTEKARLKPGYVLEAEDVVEFPMTDEDRLDMARGVELFNRGEFWESHEAWEQIWLRHQEPSRVFIQALIQLAAAYHQLHRGIRHGVVKHLNNVALKLGPFSGQFLGVDVDAIKEAVERGRAEIDRVGEAAIDEFDRALICKIAFDEGETPPARRQDRSTT
jgi:hypothetical protein